MQHFKKFKMIHTLAGDVESTRRLTYPRKTLAYSSLGVEMQ
jgi:hypothetical protein